MRRRTVWIIIGVPLALIVIGAGTALSMPAVRHAITGFMKLYVEPMDATLVEVDGEGRVRFEKEGWSTPTLQEQRAIIYAAQNEIAELTELLETLQAGTK